MACGEFFGHEDCNFNPPVVERAGHIADRESYKRSKNNVYKRKVERQIRLKGAVK